MRKKILSFLLAVSLVVSFPVPIKTVCVASAAENVVSEDEVPVYETDVATASSGCVIVGVQGEYVMDVQAAIDRINEIRLEACNKGMPNPSKPSAKLTPSDYKPIKWSADLEYIARIRAAEAIIVRGHTRPNGNRCFTLISPNNKQSYGEVLAWNWTNSFVSGIEQWYGEKLDWENQNEDAVTGHYTAMINPSNTYVGLGCFISDAGYYPNCTSGEFSSASSLSETPLDNLGKCIQKIEITKTGFDSGSLSGSNTLDVDENSKLSLTTTYTSGTKKSKFFVTSDISWNLDNPLVANVSENGVVTGLSEGVATISAESKDGFSGTLTVTVGHDWDKTTYEWNENNTKCIATRICKNNANHKETAEATIGKTEEKATCEKDGVITYTAGFDKAWAKAQTKTKKLAAVGHKTEVIAGKSATFIADGLTEGKKCPDCGKNIEAQKPIYKLAEIKLSQTEYVYDGKVKAPTLIVKDSKGNTISSKNYTISANDAAKNVGKYTYKATFKGNYAGNKTFTFKINPKPTSVSKVTAKSKGLKITLKKQKTQTSGYEIEVSTNSKFTKTVKVDIKKNTTTTATINKLKAKTKYYVRVRTYKLVNGKKIYSTWTKYKKAVTTKK